MTMLTDAQCEAYADLLITYAVGGGKPISPGSVVQLTVPDSAKPLLAPLIRSVLKAGGHPKTNFVPTNTERVFFEHAQEEQLQFFPEAFKRAEADLIDASVTIIADANPRELIGIDPAKVFRAADARRRQRDWLFEKELQGKFRWTLALFATPALAKEAGLTEREYWDQIIRACFLDTVNPIEEWKRIGREQERIKSVLNAMEIDEIHIEARDINLHVRIGADRQWLGGSLRNVPSFEIFTSPDYRGTHGTIAFDQPLFRYGSILRGISLRFHDGVVVEHDAAEGKEVLTAMLERRNARRLGEFSLTDKRFSRINRFMASTLYDENFGGEYGNTHVALGRAYREGLKGIPHTLTDAEWDERGFNDSPEHTDIISTIDRIVTATDGRGRKTVIFKDGMFQI